MTYLSTSSDDRQTIQQLQQALYLSLQTKFSHVRLSQNSLLLPNINGLRNLLATACFGMCSAHLVSRDVSPFLSFIRRVARPLGIPATRGLTDHPQHSHLPPTTCKTPRFTRQYRTPGTSMLYSYIAPQRGGDRERGEERWKEERRDEEGWEDEGGDGGYSGK